MMRRKKKDRGRDNSIEIDLTLDAAERMEDEITTLKDAAERIETTVKDILDLVRDIKEQVTPGVRDEDTPEVKAVKAT